MTMATTVERSVGERTYELVPHPYSHSTNEAAQLAHVSGKHIAKGVVLEDEDGYLMVVIPATHHVELNHLRAMLQRDVGLATEPELERLFPDCARGAVPALGPAYGLETLLDEALLEASEVLFEAGDHESLVRMSTHQFMELLGPVQQGVFSHRLDPNVHHRPRH
ncbi:MAG: YbaK/EbsC family protein [Gammaproteobacteria bacterium]|nr:YbaK/EbsC family protein [Gammaproteobacteria bacterium]